MLAADRLEGLHSATRVIRETVGARMTPIYLVDESGTTLRLTADESVDAGVIDGFPEMPVDAHVHSPWVNPEHWPVSALDHPGRDWDTLPEGFRAWFGRSGVVVPLHSDDHHLGAVLLVLDGCRRPTAREYQFLAAAGRMMGNVIYRWQLLARERELGALEERRRLADELHADLSQQLAVLAVQAELVAMDTDQTADARTHEDVARLTELVDGAKRSLRAQMLGLRSDSRLTGGFYQRLRRMTEDFERATGIHVLLQTDGRGRSEAAPPIASQVLRVVQEALNNVQLHARTGTARVAVVRLNDRIRVDVVDHGRGFDPDHVPGTKIGIRIMRERMEQIGGTLAIRTSPGEGTRVRADVVLRDPVLRPVGGDDHDDAVPGASRR